MKFFNHPLVETLLPFLQLFLGISMSGVLSGFSGSESWFSKILGSLFILIGVIGAYQCIFGSKKHTSPLVLKPEDLESVAGMVRSGKTILAITFVRQKTGAGLYAAKKFVEQIKN